MHLNDRDLAFLASGPADRDGRMYHKHLSPGSVANHREGYKERWFKLKGNLLFYYKVNEYGGVCAKEPSGVFILEDCIVKTEDEATLPFAFSITFLSEPERKHIFSSSNQKVCDEWVQLLEQCGYERLRKKVIDMTKQMKDQTGLTVTSLPSSPTPQPSSITSASSSNTPSFI